MTMSGDGFFGNNSLVFVFLLPVSSTTDLIALLICSRGKTGGKPEGGGEKQVNGNWTSFQRSVKVFYFCLFYNFSVFFFFFFLWCNIYNRACVRVSPLSLSCFPLSAN